MSIFAQMQQAFQPQGRAQTDWELLAQNMRLVALWPYLMEDIGSQRLLQLTELLRAQGIEPGTEEFSKAWEERSAPIFQKAPGLEKRGFARQLPYQSQITWQDFAQRFGPQWQQVWGQIETAAKPFIQSLPPDKQQEALNQVRAMTMAGMVPVSMRPGGEISIDQKALTNAVNTMLPRALEYLERAPQTVTLSRWLSDAALGNSPELARAAQSNPALRAWLGIPVDPRDPSRAVQAFHQVMGQNVESLVNGATLAVKAYETARDVGSYAEAARAIKALDQAITLGFIPQNIAVGLKAQLDAYKSRTQVVTLPGGQRVGMDLEQAIQYQRQQTEQYLRTVIEPLGIAAAHGRASPQEVQRALAGAAALGLDLTMVYRAVLSQEGLKVAVTRQQLANERAQAGALGERLKTERLQRAELEERARVRTVLASGEATDADYRMASIFFGADATGGVDLPTYIKAQVEQSKYLMEVTDELLKVRNPRDAVQRLMNFRSAFRGGIVLDLQGLRSPATTGQVQGGLMNAFAFIDSRLMDVVGNRAYSYQDKRSLIFELRDYVMDASRRGLIPQQLRQQWLVGLARAELAAIESQKRRK